MTADEAWMYICGNHTQYHKKLKQFGYSYDMFIPRWSFLDEIFSIPNPTSEQIKQCRDMFMQHYNSKQLHLLDDILESQTRPALEYVVETLTPFVKNWGMKIPNEITILMTYGNGGSYWPERKQIVLRGTRMPTSRIPKVLQHELVHIIIEKDIIQKYHVPHDLKERIVVIICYEYFGKEPQSIFINSFANKYITRSVIENDLPSAVQKMMSDFAVMNQKIANMNSNG